MFLCGCGIIGILFLLPFWDRLKKYPLAVLRHAAFHLRQPHGIVLMVAAAMLLTAVSIDSHWVTPSPLLYVVEEMLEMSVAMGFCFAALGLKQCGVQFAGATGSGEKSSSV